MYVCTCACVHMFTHSVGALKLPSALCEIGGGPHLLGTQMLSNFSELPSTLLSSVFFKFLSGQSFPYFGMEKSAPPTDYSCGLDWALHFSLLWKIGHTRVNICFHTQNMSRSHGVPMLGSFLLSIVSLVTSPSAGDKSLAVFQGSPPHTRGRST